MSHLDVNEINIEFWLGRLDGYLDALSIVNGYFREFRYFAYICNISNKDINTSITNLYKPDCTVTFGEVEKIRHWVRFLQEEFESLIVDESLSKAIENNKNRAFQIAWYIIEMIRIISDNFSSEEIYKCTIQVNCDKDISEGILYAIPFKDKTLVINLQKIIKS
ncbi:hypothetical protein [Thiothrix unzii]|uniref:Uncharacterized protein n=1 Tax=Thiothrix unzii TaxID=111769 RepID=A0A975F6Q2_9GAMM|nr:hypothetical protein [Thiothrix unzii]QTR52212.1 hypothetical protein J9260_10710 [Thiothrix unzii]